jgi:transposase
MEVLYERCAGLDVHKKLVVGCVRIAVPGGKPKLELLRVGTTTSDLLKLSEWLKGHEVTHIVMEATGVYWKPVWHILEGDFELTLANAQHVKAVPGRKSDVNDAQWLAELLAHGLVRASVVPPEPQRQLRDLTRTRKQLTREVARHAQRIQKVLEDANIKLDSVVSDILGVAARQIVQALAAGESDPGKLVALRGALKARPEELREALRGRMTEHHRFMLKLHLEQVTAIEKAIADLERRIEQQLEPFRQKLDRLREIPGVSRVLSWTLLAEIGTDMARFPTPAHVVSWVGLCPRLDESAGKSRSSRIRHGDIWLKTDLCQAALAARNAKNTFLRSRYFRIRTRRGPKKAIVALAATILRISYAVLRDGCSYQDLGPAHFDQLHAARTVGRLTKRLNALGYQVTLTHAA